MPAKRTIKKTLKKTPVSTKKKEVKKVETKTATVKITKKISKKLSNQTTEKALEKHRPEFIYEFGKVTHGNAIMRSLLGGKGANLAEMAKIKLPVPPGFTITTEVCNFYSLNSGKMPKGFDGELKISLANVEKQQGKKFGDESDPLLFSVRSGARDSMPGMMDTILNLGLNDKTVVGLAKKTNDKRFAYDCYRRFIHMYGDVVMGVQPCTESEHDPFDDLLHKLKERRGIDNDTDMTAQDLRDLVNQYKELIKNRTGASFPQDVHKQLKGAIGAVFKSWNNDRAFVYRQKYNIPHSWGTAVNVQAMVFGNMGKNSATGVAFTRDPANGEKVFYGEYLINAQGEDVVAGIRTPKPIAQLKKEMSHSYDELDAVRKKLEIHFKDMQDFEFTVEKGHLYMLQTRNGKRTGLAAIRIAVEMVKERLIDQKTAVRRIPAESIATLLVPIFDGSGRKKANKIAKGLPAGPGAATGKVVFTATAAEELERRGTKVVLCRQETSPEDLRGMLASEGILTSRGGVSSHAALVARQMGKVCVCGAHGLVINYANGTLTADDFVLREGDDISIDGTTGEVFAGHVDTAPSEVQQVLMGKLKPQKSYTYQLFDTVMQWSDKYRKLKIRTNADTPEQSHAAIALGAEGIGLCRTEHMFFEGDRIHYMREMILASNACERKRALKKILPFQRKDFIDIFKAMKGRPVTIRLLDPPLHEFLPHDEATKMAVANELNLSPEVVSERIHVLHEQNPMLGHRGCRLGITYPEITEMQVQGIFEAASEVTKKGQAKSNLAVEIMVPLTSFEGEFKNQSQIIHRVATEVMAAKKVKINYLVGTMIELPRAALSADKIALEAQFFSFGTNDLTQTTMGMSRDDAGKYLPLYRDLDILPQNPFATIDQGGVGELVSIAVQRGKKTRKDIKLGICGEHGGDPDSIKFFSKTGLHYVSCSPPRVPVARLAAAQAALNESN